MKQILHALAIMTIFAFPLSAKDDDGHHLTSLWKEYANAVKADRPQKQISVLEEIKRQAETEHLPWDFYDACDKYVEARSASNWKLREELEEQMSRELDRFGEAVAIVYSGRIPSDSLPGYIKANADKLKSSSHPEFWSRDPLLKGFTYGEALLKLLGSDYDYALWRLFKESGDDSAVSALMHKTYDGTYPLGELIRYSEVESGGKEEAMRNLASEHGADAVGILAENWLLNRRYRKLENDGKSTSEDFLRLLEDCRKTRKKSAALKGIDKVIAQCCTRTETIIELLGEKRIRASVQDGQAVILLSNLKNVTIKINDGKKTIFKTGVDNPVRSFHIFDTVKVTLPEINDGDYELICSSGKTKNFCKFNKYSLSMASRTNSDGLGVYVADYLSGKPLERYTLTLFRNDEAIACAEVVQDGFTALPETLSSQIGHEWSRYDIQASYRDNDGVVRKNERHGILSNISLNATPKNTKEETHCLILTDRSAFRPDETVHLKLVLYGGSSEYTPASAGMSLTAVLYDAENKEISRQNLVTGEYGSAAGEFILRKGTRGGLYSIAILLDGKRLCGKSLLVDEFVAPSFTLDWETDNRIYLLGDGVSIKGKLKSYSGHSLGEAKASYSISKYGDEYDKGDLSLSPEGDFEIKFKSDSESRFWSSYMITVKVSDSTGETLEFSRHLAVQPDILNTTDVDGSIKGSFTVRNRETGGIMINSGKLRFRVKAGGEDGQTTHPGLECSYEVVRNGKTVSKGDVHPGETLETLLPEAGLYTLRTVCAATSDSGAKATGSRETDILYIPDSCTALNDDISSLFKETDGDSLELLVGSTAGPIWAVAELYGNGDTLLDRQSVKFDGIKGESSSLKRVRFTRKKGYPSEMSIKLLWFKDKQSFSYSREFRAKSDGDVFPLSFSRFLDTTSPGGEYSFEISTMPGVECAATIFDSATETLRTNEWRAVPTPVRQMRDVSFRITTGSYDGRFDFMARGSKGLLTARIFEANEEAATGILYDTAEMVTAKSGISAADDIAAPVRKDFANTVCWEPFLRSDKDGKIEFSFRNSDKLSTYYVQLFAHDKRMHSGVLRREMTVTLPVKISVVEPLFLYDTDRYSARVSISNGSDSPVKGKVSIRLFNGKDYRTGEEISSSERPVELNAGGSASFDCPVTVSGMEELGLLASFTPEGEGSGADAVFVSIPVRPAVQTITESHSALLKAGTDRDSLIRALRGEFVNADGAAATVKEISILQMLKGAVPDRITPASNDVLSLCEALYADYLLTKIPDAARMESGMRKEICAKLIAAHNPDGGFGWFAGMTSSPIITAVLLGRFSKMGDSCPKELRAIIPDAVRFLDRSFLRDEATPLWCGGLSLEQYLSVRSLFPDVKPDTAGAQNLKIFREAAKDYLVPSGERGLNGLIFAKVRRIQTLKALLDREGGEELADFFGIRAFTSLRLRESLEKDILSLTEYAESHKSGGKYYPNAVMPWRGLLESELYAHSMICDLLSECGHDEIAEGVRLWIMVQKETQQWDKDPACIEALASVLAGGEKTLQTRVIALSLSTCRPFDEVEASGNGLTIREEYWRDGKLLTEGDILHVGDKISARYIIWNEENRSFVRLTAPRCAALRPVDQVSGHYGWRPRPLTVGGRVGFTPQGYRSVLADRTEFWFDSYPEENTTVTEDFFVTQEGTFHAPAVEIESLYAPHYRANGQIPFRQTARA